MLRTTFLPLFLGLVALVLLSPVATLGESGVGSMQLLIMAVLGATVFTVGSRRGRRWTMGLLLAAFVSSWVLGGIPGRLPTALAVAVLILAGAGALILVVHEVLKEERVTSDTVIGAAVGYLLLGLVFAGIYGFLNLVLPGAVPVAAEPVVADPSFRFAGRLSPDLLYFSLSTLSTLGPGDIAPVHPVARNITALEALLGELYLAALVARLVGLQLTNHERPASDPDTQVCS